MSLQRTMMGGMGAGFIDRNIFNQFDVPIFYQKSSDLIKWDNCIKIFKKTLPAQIEKDSLTKRRFLSRYILKNLQIAAYRNKLFAVWIFCRFPDVYVF